MPDLIPDLMRGLMTGLTLALSAATVILGRAGVHPQLSQMAIRCDKSFAKCFANYLVILWPVHMSLPAQYSTGFQNHWHSLANQG